MLSTATLASRSKRILMFAGQRSLRGSENVTNTPWNTRPAGPKSRPVTTGLTSGKTTGRIEFTCDTVLCGLRHAGNPNRSTQTGKCYQTAFYEKRRKFGAHLLSQLCVDLFGFSGKL